MRKIYGDVEKPTAHDFVVQRPKGDGGCSRGYYAKERKEIEKDKLEQPALAAPEAKGNPFFLERRQREKFLRDLKVTLKIAKLLHKL